MHHGIQFFVLAQVDLLINNWQLPLIGQMLNASLLPCFGSNAFSKSGGAPSTELQVRSMMPHSEARTLQLPC